MNVAQFEAKLNHWGREQVPFLFLVDFEMENLLAWRMNEVPRDIIFSIGDISNVTLPAKKTDETLLIKHPISFSEYKTKFDFVKERIGFGDSYLTNLTIKTKIEINRSLEDLFSESVAKYKLCWKTKFLVFSPETFIKIKDNKIYSFPMKGTIDASIPNAEQVILSDEKELSEHVTIVDLIRNDLSATAKNVNVKRFRYTEKIQTSQKDLLQVSSEIVGDLPDDYRGHIGSILISLLPAGSISGAPKKKTVQIIQKAEKEKRGFYTGVFGYFDGKNLDSAVMIRFVEQEGEHFYYRSGGGITAQSEAEKEYQEAIDKIYVPIH
ncbi:MAG TPA: aminodeoxychorismate synthase component I [Cyclobacteriaceae bacterium]|jgi:para-aminobenzoate synthetase component 1|nr:aminodeoxychorismate synthase component I [Cyclobacteriaceae bacterium]